MDGESHDMLMKDKEIIIRFYSINQMTNIFTKLIKIKIFFKLKHTITIIKLERKKIIQEV